MALTNLTQFLKSDISFQKQALFEFRYPSLFDDDSFLIDQLGFPKIDTTIGHVFLDGLQIPVHSTIKLDNEITFAMYIEEDFLNKDSKFRKIINVIGDESHQGDLRKIEVQTEEEDWEAFFKEKNEPKTIGPDPTETVNAYIYPLSFSETYSPTATYAFQKGVTEGINSYRSNSGLAAIRAGINSLINGFNEYQPPSKDPNYPCLVLHNALLKSISLNGGFSANSSTLIKFDVSLTYSYFSIENRALTS